MKELTKNNILVFRSDIKTPEDKNRISQAFDKNPSIIHWNVDFNDHEFVLRVESENQIGEDIIGMVKSCGYYCEELPD
jgi:hypothetical protein